MITLRELRGMVTINRTTGRMISAKELRESNIDIVCKEAINKSTDITVYKNGYVLYRVGNRCTVFFVPEKGSYSYESVDTTASVLEGEFFENEPWYMRLIIEGEDRMTENFRKNESKKVLGSYSDMDTEYSEEFSDPGADFVADLLCREYIDELMNLLTQQQRTAIYCYYIQGMTQDQIARNMHISQQSVMRLISRGIATLRKSADF